MNFSFWSNRPHRRLLTLVAAAEALALKADDVGTQVPLDFVSKLKLARDYGHSLQEIAQKIFPGYPNNDEAAKRLLVIITDFETYNYLMGRTISRFLQTGEFSINDHLGRETDKICNSMANSLQNIMRILKSSSGLHQPA